MSETPTETAAETSGDSAEAPATEATTEQAPEVRDPAKLLSAYEAEKTKRREQDKTLKEIREEFNAFKAKAEGKEAEFTAAQEAQRFKDEALAAANQRIVAAELRAAAKGKISADMVGDVTKFINPSDFEVGEDGTVDEAAITAAIDDLIKNKPTLTAQGDKRFQGTVDGGVRNDAVKTSQVSKAELASMTHDEINTARRAGRLRDLNF
jgi:vacuolar-type H+-ATPase subunit I/STV1